jgi:uncharacterized membrane protein YgcG
MTTNRTARLGIPLGVGAMVLAVVALTTLGGDGQRPPRLPIGLAAGGGGASASGESQSGAEPASGRDAAYWGPTTYRFADGTLDGQPTKARAHSLARGRADLADVRRLAEALGLSPAAPVREGDAWVVRAGGRELRVADEPGNPWYFHPHYAVCAVAGAPAGAEPAPLPPDAPCKPAAEPRPVESDPAQPADGDSGWTSYPSKGDDATSSDATGSDASRSGGTSGSGSGTSGGGTSGGSSSSASSGSGTDCACPEGAKCDCGEAPPPAKLGPESEARAAAQRVATASRQPDIVLRADRGYDAWYLSGDALVGGLRAIGYGLHVSVDAEGAVRDASGWLGLPEPADEYPLLRADEAAKRNQGNQPRPMIACDANTPECTGEPVTRDVTKVELGLLMAPMATADADAYLVPAWLLTLKGGDARYPEAVIALPDDYLAEPPAHDTDGSGSGGGTCEKDCDTPVSNDGGGAQPEPART